MRLDKYLKVSRLIKRRTIANEACDAGRVLVNDKPAKASANVKEGDIITIQFGNKEVKVEVIFDDAGKDIYLVEGKYINYDMYRIYRTIKQLEGRNNTKRLMGIGNLIDDEVINNYSNYTRCNNECFTW